MADRNDTVDWQYDGDWLRLTSKTDGSKLAFSSKNGYRIIGKKQEAAGCVFKDTDQLALLPVSEGAQLRLAFLGLTVDQRKEVQFKLKQYGYYSSTVDGLWGSGTEAAIKLAIKENPYFNIKPLHYTNREGAELAIHLLLHPRPLTTPVTNNSEGQTKTITTGDIYLTKVNNQFLNKPKYSGSRNALLQSVMANAGDKGMLIKGDDIYYEIFYNQIFDEITTFGFNWEFNFLKAYIHMKDKHPTWTWEDQVTQISLDIAAGGGRIYIREANDLLEKWGDGYAEFLRSPMTIKADDLESIKLDVINCYDECTAAVSGMPPSKRPDQLLCRGYATTGKVLNTRLSEALP